MQIRNNYTCPLEIVHDIIKGKWKTIIIWQLRHGNTSLSKLEHDIEGINQKMLLQQLKELIEFGMVDKIKSSSYPLHVEYFLTEQGFKIQKGIEIMQEVGVDYMVTHDMTDILDKKGICYKQ